MATELKDPSQSEAGVSTGNGTAPAFESRMDERLRNIEEGLRVQSREAKNTRRAYGAFAFFALLIAMATLVAVGFKLDKKTSGSSSGANSSKSAGAASPAKPAPLGHSSAATLKEYSISPKPSQVAAGGVAFKVHNAGKIKHEFVVLKTNKKASQLLKGSEADEAGNVGEIGNLNPGQTKTLKLNLKSGHYALICNLPGHYKLGQRADLTVR